MNNRDESLIKAVRLTLGWDCNFRCRHCIEECFSHIKQKELSQNVIDYIWHLINIKEDGDMLRIVFWGGEPLLYKDTIRKIVGIFGDKCEYSYVTNGSLIDDEWVDFCNQYPIWTALSNDGENTAKIRGVNLLENPVFCERFKRLKNKSVNGVIHAYNTDYLKFFKYVQDKVGDCLVTTECIRVTWNMPEDIYNLDSVQYEKSLREVADIAYNDIINGHFTSAVAVFYPTLRCIAREVKQDNIIHPQCERMLNSVPLDLEGNVYVCQSCDTKIGTIFDDRTTILDRYEEWLNEHTLDSCRKCDILQLCRAGCPLEISKNGHKYCCHNHHIFFGVCTELAERLKQAITPVDFEV